MHLMICLTQVDTSDKQGLKSSSTISDDDDDGVCHSSSTSDDNGEVENVCTENEAKTNSKLDSDDELLRSRKKAVNKTLTNFYEYLPSADSGNRDKKTAIQWCDRGKKILKIVSPGLCMQSLIDRKLQRDKFLKEYCTKQEYHPKAIPTYIKNLEHFLNYVLGENLDQLLNLKKVESLKCTLVLRKSSFIKTSREATMQRMEKERKTKITPQDVLQFESLCKIQSKV